MIGKIKRAILNNMIDPTKIDMNQVPKKFCDGAIGGFGKEIFSFALTSGNNLDAFAVTPQTMKSIAIWISGQVQNYEKGINGISAVRLFDICKILNVPLASMFPPDDPKEAVVQPPLEDEAKRGTTL